jgi:hypothetical protein
MERFSPASLASLFRCCFALMALLLAAQLSWAADRAAGQGNARADSNRAQAPSTNTFSHTSGSTAQYGGAYALGRRQPADASPQATGALAAETDDSGGAPGSAEANSAASDNGAPAPTANSSRPGGFPLGRFVPGSTSDPSATAQEAQRSENISLLRLFLIILLILLALALLSFLVELFPLLLQLLVIAALLALILWLLLVLLG